MSYLSKPKFRNINVQRIVQDGQPLFLLNDSLRLTDVAVALPQALGPVVVLCDGDHTPAEIEAKLMLQYGLQLPHGALDQLLSQFDEALLLEGGKFETAKHAAIEKYRRQPNRPAALAGRSYPAQASDIRRLFGHYVDGLSDIPQAASDSRALISPHIDYQRGGPVYAAVWASAAAAVREAELVIVLATDHNGGLGTLTPTLQRYASPLGTMPTDTELVNQLAEIIGPEAAFAEELHHIGEHSIELVLLWLQYVREQQNQPACPILPILCGSFYHFIHDEADLAQVDHFRQMTQRLREVMQQRRTLIVASGDLAHMGPAFDGEPMHHAEYEQMLVDDDALLDTLSQGQAQPFFEFMRGQYERNVCGLSPFYFTLDLLGETNGQLVGYDRCPADENDTSFVSICGMVMQ